MTASKTFSALLISAAASGPALAQGFSVMVSPPRFELEMQAGDAMRNVVEISNLSDQTSRLSVRSADWTLDREGGVAIHDPLQPTSCRPWVAIERRQIEIPPRGRYRYRFEVAPPTGTPASQCRFALVVEGGETEVSASGGLRFPVSGRIAVLVYVSLGDAAPQFALAGTGTSLLNGQRVPFIHMRNDGNAHGRVMGFLAGTDARGRKLEFTPSSLPVLPGETRALALLASASDTAPGPLAFPITIRGTLEAGTQKLPFEQRFE